MGGIADVDCRFLFITCEHPNLDSGLKMRQQLDYEEFKGREGYPPEVSKSFWDTALELILNGRGTEQDQVTLDKFCSLCDLKQGT